jgi:hypothetical protein
MFGGGIKKEKKEEDQDRGDVSGSAKAQKEAAAEENPEVRLRYIHMLKKFLMTVDRRRRLSQKTSILNPLSASPRRLRSKPTKNLRSRPSRCAQSFLSLSGSPTSGRSVAQAM